MSIKKNKLEVDISRNVGPMEGEPDDKSIVKTLTSVVEFFKDEPSEISLHVVSKKEMQDLNKKFTLPTCLLSPHKYPWKKFLY